MSRQHLSNESALRACSKSKRVVSPGWSVVGLYVPVPSIRWLNHSFAPDIASGLFGGCRLPFNPLCP